MDDKSLKIFKTHLIIIFIIILLLILGLTYKPKVNNLDLFSNKIIGCKRSEYNNKIKIYNY